MVKPLPWIRSRCSSSSTFPQQKKLRHVLGVELKSSFLANQVFYQNMPYLNGHPWLCCG